MRWGRGPVKRGVAGIALKAERRLTLNASVGLVRQLSFAVAIVVCFGACSTIPKREAAGQWPAQASIDEAPAKPKRKVFLLSADDFWRLELPEGKQFDASGLVWADGKLLVVADGYPTLFEVEFGLANSARLNRTAIFTSGQLAPFTAGKRGRFDFEGLARDAAGRIYACEEANRWIFRFDAAAQKVERIEIDWAPVWQFLSADENASF